MALWGTVKVIVPRYLGCPGELLSSAQGPRTTVHQDFPDTSGHLVLQFHIESWNNCLILRSLNTYVYN